MHRMGKTSASLPVLVKDRAGFSALAMAARVGHFHKALGCSMGLTVSAGCSPIALGGNNQDWLFTTPGYNTLGNSQRWLGCSPTAV